MKLLTKEIEEMFRASKRDEETPAHERKVLCKFFDPTGRLTLYVLEAEEGEYEDENGKPYKDWCLFGYMVSPLGPDCDEFGYSMLSELQAVRGRFGLGIERDLHFGHPTLGEAVPSLVPCRECQGGSVVCDTCDECGGRHCQMCSPCAPLKPA